jgi:hypothetical protein
MSFGAHENKEMKITDTKCKPGGADYPITPVMQNMSQ